MDSEIDKSEICCFDQKENVKYIYISGAETGLVLLVPGTTNNSVNVIQNGLKIIH